jgi:predicted DNA-binding transcriptional regulator
LTTLLSCVPPEVIEELKKQIEEELEERKNKKDA